MLETSNPFLIFFLKPSPLLSVFLSKIPLEETVSELRKELEQCLISNKAKREQVYNLEKELSSFKDQLKEQETKAQRMEMIAQEHEVERKQAFIFLCVIFYSHSLPLLCFLNGFNPGQIFKGLN